MRKPNDDEIKWRMANGGPADPGRDDEQRAQSRTVALRTSERAL